MLVIVPYIFFMYSAREPGSIWGEITYQSLGYFRFKTVSDSTKVYYKTTQNRVRFYEGILQNYSKLCEHNQPSTCTKSNLYRG